MKHRIVHTEKKTYNKYDTDHYLLYLGEEILDNYIPGDIPEDSELKSLPITGYAYTGDQPDGGTLIQANESTYEAFVDGLIRNRYTQSEVEAIQANTLLSLTDPGNVRAEEFRQEWAAYQEYREKCKADAKAILKL